MPQSVGEIALDIVMGKNTVSSVAKDAIKDVQSTFNSASSTIAQKAQSVGSACTSIGSAMLPVSTAAAGVALGASKMAMDYETAMAKVTTIAGKTAVQYKGSTVQMSDAILKLSNDTGVAAGECAEATYSAISAGVDTAKSVTFVSQANALAKGGFTDLTTSVDVLTTAINAYGFTADDAGMVSDRLITTQNLGKTTVDELAGSMGKVIPAASAYGVSIDNLCSAYVSLTKGGIATAESTTYIKGMLNELGNSGSQVGKILQQQTGKSFTELMAEGKSLGDVMGILGQSVDGDTAAFGQLWGSQEAGMGAMAILNGGVDDFNSSMTQMASSTGAAGDAAETMADTKAAKLNKALNTCKNAGIELGGSILTTLAPAIEVVSGAVSGLANFFSSLPEPIQQIIGVVLLVVAAAGPLLIMIGQTITAVTSLAGAIPMLTGAFGAISTLVTGTVMPALSGFFAFLLANPVVLVIAAIVAAIALLVMNWDTVSQVAQKCWTAICDTVSQAGEWITTTWNNLCTSMSQIWENIKLGISEFIASVLGFFTGLSESMSVIWGGMQQIASGAWELLKNIILAPVLLLCDLVTGDFEQLKTDASNIWNNIKDAASQIWSGIQTVVGGLVDGTVNGVKSAWSSAKETISNTWNNLKSNASSTWSNIKSTVGNAAQEAGNGAVNAFNSMKNGIQNAISQVPGIIINGLNSAISFLTSLPSQAWSWGSDMISGFANGVTSAMSGLLSTVSSMASSIRSMLHFSCPDTGPLADYETWMPDFINGMAKGVQRNQGTLIGAIQSMADDMTVNPSMAIAAPALKTGTTSSVTKQAQTSTAEESKLSALIKKLADVQGGMGDITIPVYIGNDIVDEIIVKANDRRMLRSGGRA